MVKLGDKVRDIVSGYEGIVIGVTHYLHGCTVCGVKSQGLHDGKPVSTQWFDMPQLKTVKKKAVKQGTRITGGPHRDIPQRRDEPEYGDPE